LLFFSYKASGANDTLWVALSYIIGPLVIALLSIKYGVGGWNKFDIFCLSSSFVSTLFWFITGSPIIALILYLLIDSFGTLPTIRKSYYHPEQENKLGWLLMITANLFNFFAAKEMKFSITIYPFYMLITGCIIFGLSLRKPQIKVIK